MMKIMKRAQAATEFIMTYGWAILVVLAAIGALAYFGVLSPDKFLPERCNFPAGIDCVDKAVITSSTGTVEIALRNNVGYPINLQSVSGTDDCTAANMTSPAINAQVANNGKTTMTINCSTTGSLTLGSRFKSDITIVYIQNET